MSVGAGVRLRHSRSTCGLVALALSALSTALQAQEIDIPMAVEERMEGRMAPDGIQLGALRLQPSAQVELIYDDNVYAQDSNARSDLLLSGEFLLGAQSDFGRHAIGADFFARRRQFFTLDTENVTEFGAAVHGRLDISRDGFVNMRVGSARRAERRGDIDAQGASRGPARYTIREGEASIEKQFNRLKLSANASVRSLSYDDVTIAGVPVDQGFRDYNVARGVVTTSFDMTSQTAFFVRSEYERRRYDLRLGDPGFDPAILFDRSAQGYRLEAGVSRQLNAVISGNARVGYLHYRYDDDRLPDINGFSYSTEIRWDITRMTAITLTALRRLDETLSPLNSGYLRDEFGARVQHELLRYVMLDSGFTYANINAIGPSADLTQTRADAGVRWFVRKNLVVEGRYHLNVRKSDDGFSDFTDNQFMIGVTFRR